MENSFGGAKSLCSVDLRRQLFDNTVRAPSIIGDGPESVVLDTTPQTLAAAAGNQKKEQVADASKMKRIRLPSPIFTLQAALNQPCKIDCFPLVDRKMFWADHLGRTFLFDAETRQMDIIPMLHKPKWMPFSLFVPNADADNDYDQDRFGSSLFVMERIPKPEGYCSRKRSDQFEVFVYRTPTMTYSKSWQCQLLPPPPYVRELKYWHNYGRPEIISYALLSVSGDSYISISVQGVGTYCLDTGSHKWRKVGTWILPFHGRVEYVPELKLWFGFNTVARHLAAADISSMDSQPQLVGSWKELYLPEEWKECKDPQLVNLGCGRFCIIRFFRTGTHNSDPRSDDQNVAVFTGVEVVPCVQDANGGCGKVELQMIPHKSLYHVSNGTTINAVF
jgi:hypothetical protein